MKSFLQLSAENIELSKAEAENLLKIKGTLKGRLLFTDIANSKLIERLALTNAHFKHIFSCKENELEINIEKFNWNKIYKSNYCIRTHKKNGKAPSEKEIATQIWKKLKNPKVNLKKPETLIEFFYDKGTVHCGKLEQGFNHTFEQRKSHKRPANHPTSLHPKLARAVVNLTGINKGTIADLFCGAGGILLEAGLMGLKPVGYDLFSEMIVRADKNLKYYKIKNFKLKQHDALLVKTKFNYIVSDVPYGMNTSVRKKLSTGNEKVLQKNIQSRKEQIESLEEFYLSFLKNLKQILKKRAVIIMPHFVNYNLLIKKAGLKLEQEFEQYIHGSLTRKILVLI